VEVTHKKNKLKKLKEEMHIRDCQLYCPNNLINLYKENLKNYKFNQDQNISKMSQLVKI